MVKRFINADEYASTGQGFLGYNMFAYCENNPVVFTDFNGQAPEWWQRAISGAMVVTGIALAATGVGGIAGGALICAGANSIIGSYISESNNGSSVADWAGGMITGAICGAGAGLAGNLLIEATESTGVACIGKVAAYSAVSFGSGFGGSILGQLTANTIDKKPIAVRELVENAGVVGAINCIAGMGSGIGNAIKGMPAISTTSITLANGLNAGWSVLAESLCDFLGTVSSVFTGKPTKMRGH